MEYVDRGLQPLKGFPEPKRLFEVVWLPTTTTIADEPLAETAAPSADETEIAAVKAAARRAINVLTRVLGISHLDDPAFPSLLECQAKASELRVAVSRAGDRFAWVHGERLVIAGPGAEQRALPRPYVNAEISWSPGDRWLAYTAGDFTRSPRKPVADVIAAAKAKPGSLSFAHAGNGTSTHLAGELLKSLAKVDIVAVPYKGGAPAINDLIGGQIPLSFNNGPESVGQISAGAVRALGVTTAKRAPFLPDVPPIAEAGVPGYDTGVWWGLVGRCLRWSPYCGTGFSGGRVRGRSW